MFSKKVTKHHSKIFFINLGVICENEADTAKLLRADNINQEKLFEYAREAADFATEYQMPHLDFAVNHYGKPDVAMFDFTSMFQVHLQGVPYVLGHFSSLQH